MFPKPGDVRFGDGPRPGRDPSGPGRARGGRRAGPDPFTPLQREDRIGEPERKPILPLFIERPTPSVKIKCIGLIGGISYGHDLPKVARLSYSLLACKYKYI